MIAMKERWWHVEKDAVQITEFLNSAAVSLKTGIDQTTKNERRWHHLPAILTQMGTEQCQSST